jgi:hypothetical protein
MKKLTMNTRQAAIAKLKQLSEPSLEKVNQFLDSLLIEQQTQALETPSEQTLKEKWEKWFSEVDQLEIHPSSLDYHQQLLNKYRQQGLEL